MLTSSDLLQALRPAFIVYALAMASTGAALRLAPDDARQAAARAPAGLRWVRMAEHAFADASAERPVASVSRVARPLPAGRQASAGACTRAVVADLPSPAATTQRAFLAGALAAVP